MSIHRRCIRVLRIGFIAAVALCIPAQVALCSQISYQAVLDGPSEAPPNASPGTGVATVTVDLDLNTMRVQVSFAGLLGTTTASHIHGPTASPGVGNASVATQTPRFIGFPTGVTSGSYDHTFDLTLASSYNPAFITANGGTVAGAENSLLGALSDGRAYLNVHTSVFPGGEIRGFLSPIATPDSGSTLVLLASGVVALLGVPFVRGRAVGR